MSMVASKVSYQGINNPGHGGATCMSIGHIRPQALTDRIIPERSPGNCYYRLLAA